MAIAVSCTCGRQFRAKDDHGGRRTRCPACAAELVIAGEHLPDHDVFISYSSKDKLVADAVCGRLEERRVRCWIAPRDVRPGMEWSSSIIDAIADSAVMVLLFTGNSNQSPQVLREVERAVNKGVAVLPLRLEETGLSKSMEYFISASHWLDAISPPLEQHLEVLVATIKGILARRKLNGAGADAGGAGVGPGVGAAAAGPSAPSSSPAPSAPSLPSPHPAAQPIPSEAGAAAAPDSPPVLSRPAGRTRRRWQVAVAAAGVLLFGGLLAWGVTHGRREQPRAAANTATTGAASGPTATGPRAAPAPTLAVAAAPAAGKGIAATAPGAPTAAQSRVVNLLPLIDLASDTVEGHWRFEDGRLVSDGAHFARVQIRYNPPPEYDFRIEFVRLRGLDDVVQMVDLGGGHRVVWQMAGVNGKYWLFSDIVGQSKTHRISMARVPPHIVNGQRHVAFVQVRRDAISAYFDGQMVSYLQMQPSDLSLALRWSLPGASGLGLGTNYSPTRFYAAEVTELTTNDKAPAAPAAPAAR